jgi:hypothetical protein
MFSPYYWNNHKAKVALGWINRLWWRFMPGTMIKVRWPTGELIVDHTHPLWEDMGGAVWVNLGYSSDPNDHYRPDIEKHVGRQGWDWDWCMRDGDVVNNLLTIKFRKGKDIWATHFALMWS